MCSGGIVTRAVAHGEASDSGWDQAYQAANFPDFPVSLPALQNATRELSTFLRDNSQALNEDQM
jgi:hypothetical protein